MENEVLRPKYGDETFVYLTDNDGPRKDPPMGGRAQCEARLRTRNRRERRCWNVTARLSRLYRRRRAGAHFLGGMVSKVRRTTVGPSLSGRNVERRKEQL